METVPNKGSGRNGKENGKEGVDYVLFANADRGDGLAWPLPPSSPYSCVITAIFPRTEVKPLDWGSIMVSLSHACIQRLSGPGPGLGSWGQNRHPRVGRKWPR